MDPPTDLKALKEKYRNHVFVHVKRSLRALNMPELDKQKFIVPREMTVGGFIFLVRKRMQLPAEKAMFLFVNDTIPTSSCTMGELCAQHGKDGFLSVQYAGENTFG